MEHIRAAGHHENRCAIREILGLYGYIVATARYEGPKLLSKDWLYNALKICIAQHPMMSTVIQGAGSSNSHLFRTPTINLDKHVRYIELQGGPEHNTDSLRGLLLMIHNEPQTEYESIPQWRVWVFPSQQSTSLSKPSFWLAFACSHTIADGMSLYAFHRTFIQALSQTISVSSSPDAIYEVTSKNTLLSALNEHLLPFLTNLGDEEDAVGTWYGAATPPILPSPSRLLQTELELRVVSPITLQGVLQVCRAKNARLTALLNYVTSRATAGALSKRGQEYSIFGVETSINLRKCIPQAQNQIANYPSAIEQVHDVSANPDPSAPLRSEDWEMVREYTAELAKMSNTLSDQPIARLSNVFDFRNLILNKASGPATGSFGTSNLGVFVNDLSTEQDWRIKEMMFSQSADATSAAFNINVSSVAEGPLAITLTWWPGMLGVHDESSFARDILKAVEDQLEAISWDKETTSY